ncbi:MAG: hypothetical protein RMZ42_31705, partial [Nostoc sp. DedQUE05]|uniref:hypothetical protein n=1 Tax=Nostoc sp. DedQUE05 TaxID=3075391 RepID=UPI002AD436B2
EYLNWMNPPFISVNEYLNRMNPPFISVNEYLNWMNPPLILVNQNTCKNLDVSFLLTYCLPLLR